jgi:hypothetical protein
MTFCAVLVEKSRTARQSAEEPLIFVAEGWPTNLKASEGELSV